MSPSTIDDTAAVFGAAVSPKALPPPKDLSHLFSVVTKNRNPSAVKAFYKFMRIPGISNFAGGEFGIWPALTAPGHRAL
jgi:hypothetical protein